MKETTKMSRAISQLEHIYNALNEDFFEGELPTPIITVQSKPGTYGHCSKPRPGTSTSVKKSHAFASHQLIN